MRSTPLAAALREDDLQDGGVIVFQKHKVLKNRKGLRMNREVSSGLRDRAYTSTIMRGGSLCWKAPDWPAELRHTPLFLVALAPRFPPKYELAFDRTSPTTSTNTLYAIWNCKVSSTQDVDVLIMCDLYT